MKRWAAHGMEVRKRRERLSEGGDMPDSSCRRRKRERR